MGNSRILSVVVNKLFSMYACVQYSTVNLSTCLLFLSTILSVYSYVLGSLVVNHVLWHT